MVIIVYVVYSLILRVYLCLQITGHACLRVERNLEVLNSAFPVKSGGVLGHLEYQQGSSLAFTFDMN